MGGESPADLIKFIFITTGVAVPYSGSPNDVWPVVVDQMPAGGPDNFLSVNDTGGVTETRGMDGGRVFWPSVMVTVRAADYQTGFAQGRRVERLLDALGAPGDRSLSRGRFYAPVRVGGLDFIVQNVKVYTPTTKVGQEQQGRRHLFTVNARFLYRSLADG